MGSLQQELLSQPDMRPCAHNCTVKVKVMYICMQIHAYANKDTHTHTHTDPVFLHQYKHMQSEHACMIV